MEPPSYTLDFEKPLRDLERQLDELRQQSVESNVDLVKETRAIEKKIEQLQREIYSNLTPWQKVQVARHPKRPYALDYVGMICRGFQELHGDRQFNDDRALVGGTAFFDGQAVVIIAQQKGRDPKERIVRNFGMPQPEGYRKALRIMKMAERFGLPVLSFIDTPGAFPGVGSEERHVSEAIAVNLREMAMLRTPTVSVVVGEGGSVAVAVAVDQTQRIVQRVDPHEGEHGTKDLVGVDLHVFGDVVDKTRSEPETMRVASDVGLATVDGHARAFVFANAEIRRDLVAMLGRDERTHLGRCIGAGADGESRHPGLDSFDQFVSASPDRDEH